MPTRNINLTDHLDSFVEEKVTSGRYQNASEVVREGLRLLEDREKEDQLKLESLRAAVQLGEEAVSKGRYRDVDPEGLQPFLEGLNHFDSTDR